MVTGTSDISKDPGCSRARSSFISIAVIKTHLRRERVRSQFQVTVHYVRESRRQRLRTAYHFTSTVKRGLNACMPMLI